ncbi:MAG: hypothetical protein H6R01_1912 [Burkholderiaceae bacterium]|nr:hypothetical protein [Burkholderiaceae bacterium]
MHQTNFIVREPLLDPKQQVIGYELSWQRAGMESDVPGDEDLGALISYVAQQLNDDEDGWLMGGAQLFLEATPALMAGGALEGLLPQQVVLVLNRVKLDSPDTIEAVKNARAKGFGILLRNANSRTPNKDLMSCVTHIEVRCGDADVAKLAKLYAALKHSSSVRMVASQVGSWQEYDTCASLGLDAFVGKLHLTPREGYQPKGMNPSQALIMQLMDQVRKNADVPHLESLLKRDAALSYKLLRYINSAGFGLRTEIHSLKHAVTLIGYSPLYRWLSLLLATASTTENAAVLMQTAIVRGRMAELLAQDKLPKADAENLFVTGMFSLLDRLLGIPMEEVLRHIQLSEPVTQALQTREGPYGPYLALAEACEIRNGFAGALANVLSLQPREVNGAHLAALAWSQSFTG